MAKDIKSKAAKIKLIALDNDGVFTDGKVIISDLGVESKSYFIRDGFSIIAAQRAGLKFAIITGLKTPNVELRAEQLGIKEVHKGFVEKKIVMNKILTKHKLAADEVAYMGDDLFDLPVLRMVGFSATPADGIPEVRKEVDFVAEHNGGAGAVRDMVEFILKAKGLWESILAEFAAE